MSITEGMAEHWGNFLVSDPFKIRLIKLIKKIIKKIVRYIPWLRKKFKIKVVVQGDLAIPVSYVSPVTGDYFVSKIEKLPIFGDKALRTSQVFPLFGHLSVPSKTVVGITGTPALVVSSKLAVLGDYSTSYLEKVELKGERDITKQLWTILEDEEE